jgi:hypothetical protein
MGRDEDSDKPTADLTRITISHGALPDEPPDEPNAAPQANPFENDPFAVNEPLPEDPAVQLPADFAGAEAPAAVEEPGLTRSVSRTSIPQAHPSSNPSSGEPTLGRETVAGGAAIYPWTVLIEGTLRPNERDRLLEILSEEKVPLREIDLEPQFASGRIKIPRISEYVGIRIIMAVREGAVRIVFQPSDASVELSGDVSTTDTGLQMEVHQSVSRTRLHPADQIPVLLGDDPKWIPFDSVTASANLRSTLLEATRSPDYERLVEALTRKIRYEAYAKGGKAVVRFSLSLIPLQSPSLYRVMATGMAARLAP